MGYPVKVQKISRPTNRTFYVTIPVVLVAAVRLEKGELWQWTVDDCNTMVLERVKPIRARRRDKTRGTATGG